MMNSKNSYSENRSVNINFVIILMFAGLGITSCWIPFFGEQLHHHGDLESHKREWDLLQITDFNGSDYWNPQAKSDHYVASHWSLQEYDRIILDSDKASKISSSLNGSISFYFVYKQHQKSIASLFSIYLPKREKPFFKIISDLNSHKLLILYRIQNDAELHQLTFKIPEKIGFTWSKLLVSINRTHARVWANCDHYEKHSLDGIVDLQFPLGSMMYFRHGPGTKTNFPGNIKVGKIMNYSHGDRVWRCTYDAQFGKSWKPPLLG